MDDSSKMAEEIFKPILDRDQESPLLFMETVFSFLRRKSDLFGNRDELENAFYILYMALPFDQDDPASSQYESPTFEKVTRFEAIEILTADREYDDVLYPLLTEHGPFGLFERAVNFLKSTNSYRFDQNNVYKIMQLLANEKTFYKYVRYVLLHEDKEDLEAESKAGSEVIQNEDCQLEKKAPNGTKSRAAADQWRKGCWKIW